jgi:hypothetical protein
MLVIGNIVPSSSILVTQMMEVMHSYELPVLTRATWCNIPFFEDGMAQQEVFSTKEKGGGDYI